MSHLESSLNTFLSTYIQNIFVGKSFYVIYYKSKVLLFDQNFLFSHQFTFFSYFTVEFFFS